MTRRVTGSTWCRSVQFVCREHGLRLINCGVPVKLRFGGHDDRLSVCLSVAPRSTVELTPRLPDTSRCSLDQQVTTCCHSRRAESVEQRTRDVPTTSPQLSPSAVSNDARFDDVIVYRVVKATRHAAGDDPAAA